MDDQTGVTRGEGADDDAEFAALRQRGTRDSMFLQATLRRQDGHTIAVRVRNISKGGVLVECPASVWSGEQIAVDLRGIGYIDGKVAWAVPGRFGVAFDRDIDPLLTRKPLSTGPRAAPLGPMVVSLRRPGLRFD